MLEKINEDKNGAKNLLLLGLLLSIVAQLVQLLVELSLQLSLPGRVRFHVRTPGTGIKFPVTRYLLPGGPPGSVATAVNLWQAMVHAKPGMFSLCISGRQEIVFSDFIEEMTLF